MDDVFMVLGGSIGQIKAIRTVQRLGMKALVVDRNPKALGAAIADFFEPVDIVDFSGVEKVARDYNIAGCMTMSSDIGVPTVCHVNEALGLPNQGLGIGGLVTDKYAMHQCFKKNGVRTPRCYKIENPEEQEVVQELILAELVTRRYFIVKPSDSSGSRGVTKINCACQLNDAMRKARDFSRSGRVILEEFINGIEIGAQGLSIKGELVLCLIHNDTLSPNMIPIGHSFPVRLNGEQVETIKIQCSKALKSLGIENGPSNIDIIIDQSGQPHIIEIGARIGATRLPELVEYHTGFDVVELSIRLATGQSVQIPTPASVPVATELLWFYKSGQIKDIGDCSHLLAKHKVVAHELSIGPGVSVNPLVSGADNYGYVLCNGENAWEAERNCLDFMNQLKTLIDFE